MSKEIPVIKRNQFKFYFDKEAEPVLIIKSGDTVLVETEDANVSHIRKNSDIYYDFSRLYDKAGGCNPLGGPIYVEGAKVGDFLAVEILEVEPGAVRGEGYTSVFPGLGALASPFSIQEPLEPRTKICRIKDGKVLFETNSKERTIKIPVDAFVGTIGVAPKEERRSSLYNGKDFCGNVDCPDIKAGATVILPVNVDGALLSVADVHAVQGDGEIAGCALECQGDVKIRVKVLSEEEAQFCDWAQVNTPEWIGSIVSLSAITLADQIRAGYVDLVKRMVKYYGFDKIDAYQLLNLVGKVTVGQVLDQTYSCVVKIRREFLK